MADQVMYAKNNFRYPEIPKLTPLPYNSVDASNFIRHFPGTFEYPTILIGKMFAIIAKFGQIGLGAH